MNVVTLICWEPRFSPMHYKVLFTYMYVVNRTMTTF